MLEHIPSPPEDLLERMLLLLNGHCVEQALHVAAVLGIADLLAGCGKTSGELAASTGADAPSLYRLLRTLASVGVFSEDQDGKFALTALGATLRSDVANSVRDRAIYYGSEEMWKVWGNLLHCVRTGESACERVYTEHFYDYLAEHPVVGVPFNRYMTKTSEQHVAAILDSYDFSPVRTLVDVGGGEGGTLAAILKAYPTIQGILFDLPRVLRGVTSPEVAGLLERCKLVGGDMHQCVPFGGDLYLVKWVLMDRSDEGAINVLRNCKEAMSHDGKILVVEMIMPSDNKPSFSKVMDLQMMLLFGRGRIRTREEFRILLKTAGLTAAQWISTQSPNSIIEVVRR
jgi:O-methyltransferase domain